MMTRTETPIKGDAPLIHIGYHKTGSTWLQRSLFYNPDTVFYSPWGPKEIIEHMIIVNPFRFDPKQLRSRFELDLIKARQSVRIPVISHEMLSGNPRRCLCKGRLNAERLAATFPDARILIVIREQKDILLSWYKHHVRAGSPLSLKQFLDQPDPTSGFEPVFPWQYFEYDALIRFYQELFGQDRTLTLPFELLTHDSKSFIRRISEFVGADVPSTLPSEPVNPGYSGITVIVRRTLNRLTHRDAGVPHRSRFDQSLINLLWHIERWSPSRFSGWYERRLRMKIEFATGDYFAASNQRTGKLIHMELGPYGYATRAGANELSANLSIAPGTAT